MERAFISDELSRTAQSGARMARNAITGTASRGENGITGTIVSGTNREGVGNDGNIVTQHSFCLGWDALGDPNAVLGLNGE